MIIGSGLLAQAFPHEFQDCEDICIYAAGVSNSGCTNAHEFLRERLRLEAALKRATTADAFIYFGTCSIADPDARNAPYVQHKMMMEELVSRHVRHLILRLPQIVGKTPNPHTLLNFLYARISRSESFDLWGNARRNIIDVVDAASIAQQIISETSIRNTTLNIANTVSYSMLEIVAAMESVVGKPAIYEVVDRGSEYSIDVCTMLTVLDKAGVRFGNDYLTNVVGKYYSGAE